MPDNPYSSPSQQASEVEPQPRVYQDAEDELLDNSMTVRILGAIVVTMGCLLGYFAVYAPLWEAIGQKRSFYPPPGVAGLMVITVICGSIMLVAGRHTRRILLHRWYDATPVNVIVSTMVVLIAIAVDILFEKFAASMG